MRYSAAFAAVLLVVFVSISASGQVRTFKWSDELCEYTGTYDARKYTDRQLRNTVRMMGPGEYSLVNTPMVFKPADIDSIDLAKLDTEYRQKSDELRSLDIVKASYWQLLRTRMLDEMRQVYELARITSLGYRDPNRLMELDGADSCRVEFARPLIAGGDDLLAAWLKVNQDARAKNSDPDRVRREYEAQLASPDRMRYAVVEVTTFGWWNCANRSIKYVEHDGTSEREFKKLFVKVKDLGCDEP